MNKGLTFFLFFIFSVASPVAVIQAYCFESRVSLFEDATGITLVSRLPEGEARAVMFFCTWESRTDSLVARLENRSDWLVASADSMGLLLVTWPTVRARFPGDSTETVFARLDKWTEHWHETAERFCEMNSVLDLPRLGFGFSRGASYMYIISSNFPNFFTGLHLHCLVFTIPENRKIADCVYLITFGNDEIDEESAKSVAIKLHGGGTFPIIRKFEKLGHDMRMDVASLATSFFDFCIELVEGEPLFGEVSKLYLRQLERHGVWISRWKPGESDLSGYGDYSGEFSILPSVSMAEVWRGWSAGEVQKRISGRAFIIP